MQMRNCLSQDMSSYKIVRDSSPGGVVNDIQQALHSALLDALSCETG
jgi:hypothetical protein